MKIYVASVSLATVKGGGGVIQYIGYMNIVKTI
jgi:hypothetical protein